MKLLNLACGAIRPKSVEGVEWLNVDTLRDYLIEGTPERSNLDAEPNYRNRNLLTEGLSLEMEGCDGILMSHCVEHWTCQEAAFVMHECWISLKTGGVLLVSVPDASYFRKVHDRDTVENAVELFGEPIHLPDGETTFFGYGLFNRYHKAILTEDVLWTYFVRAGFRDAYNKTDFEGCPCNTCEAGLEMAKHLNRLPFSLVMCAIKE